MIGVGLFSEQSKPAVHLKSVCIQHFCLSRNSRDQVAYIHIRRMQKHAILRRNTVFKTVQSEVGRNSSIFHAELTLPIFNNVHHRN
jgi:hypothetical protein